MTGKAGRPGQSPFQVARGGVLESVHHTGVVVRLPPKGGGPVFATAAVGFRGLDRSCVYRSEGIGFPVSSGSVPRPVPQPSPDDFSFDPARRYCFVRDPMTPGALAV